ncbi:MAG: type I 3-dehydroquinate dehydratase [Bacteroidales bacterium]|nr:type I 3-dehydroquinate dehydratase [Bacteroidales bacterium]
MGRICYSLKDVSRNYCLFMAATRRDAFIEIRLDACDFDEDDIRAIFSFERKTQLIATYHVSLPSQVETAARRLTAAILAGADYVDIPSDFPENSRQWLMNLAMNHGTRIILSYHNYARTEPLPQLLQTAEQLRRSGADIVKVVTTARSEEDTATILALYEHFAPGRLLAFAMGEKGRDSRFLALEKGAPFLFVTPTRDGATAIGQPCPADLLPANAFLLRGEASLPASKSFAQRAILLAALANGTTKLYGVTPCDDVMAAIGVARSLYADIALDGTTLTIEGHQHVRRDGLRVREGTLFVGESGLLARLCIPLAGLSREPVLITGEKTLLRRRIDDQRGALRKLGLRLNFTDRSHLPVQVRGQLHHGVVELSGEKGSQMISGLLLALSQCEGESALIINKVSSEPYIRLTTYIASFFGLSGYDCPELADSKDTEEDDNGQRTWYIEPDQAITPVLGLEVERDWSAAAMLLVAGALAGDVTLHGLDLHSRQADAIIYSLLCQNHADILHDSEKNTISVRRSIICPFYYDISDAPDLFAPLFVMACFAEGESVIAGVGRLRNKESDRAATFAEEFRKLGVRTSVSRNEMTIYGQEGRRLRAAACTSHGDHRLAMALTIASLFADGPVPIDDTACITKSFPGFLETIELLRRH